MNYKKIYDNLMLDRKKRGIDKELLDGYYEFHHIIPKCMGGNNNQDNLVLLTMREHLFAHLLLVKIYPDHIGILNAINAMFCCGKSRIVDIKYTRLRSTKVVASIREKALSRPITDEIRQHMRDGHKNITDEQREHWRKGSTGRIQTKETRLKRSKTLTGRTFSETHKENISKAKKGKVAYWPTKETNKKRSKSIKLFYETHKKSNEDKLKMSERAKVSRTDKRGTKHKFKVIDKNEKIFDSVKECAKYYGVNRNTIRIWVNKFPEKGFRYID